MLANPRDGNDDGDTNSHRDAGFHDRDELARKNRSQRRTYLAHEGRGQNHAG